MRATAGILVVDGQGCRPGRGLLGEEGCGNQGEWKKAADLHWVTPFLDTGGAAWNARFRGHCRIGGVSSAVGRGIVIFGGRGLMQFTWVSFTLDGLWFYFPLGLRGRRRCRRSNPGGAA